MLCALRHIMKSATEELDSGDFIVIGRNVTSELQDRLPTTASCGPDEQIVWVPRKTLVLAKSDIPEKV